MVVLISGNKYGCRRDRRYFNDQYYGLFRFLLLVVVLLSITLSPGCDCKHKEGERPNEGSTSTQENVGNVDMKPLSRILNGDLKGLDGLLVDPQNAYDLLSSEILQTHNPEEEWYLIQALAEVPDKRVILFFVKWLLSHTNTTSGEMEAFVRQYLRNIVGQDLASLEEYEAWYEQNEDAITWEK